MIDRAPATIAPHVLENRGQPGPTVRARPEAVKRLKRLHHRFLYQVFGFGSIPLEPHGQPEQPIEVGQGLRLEGSPRRVGGGWR